MANIINGILELPISEFIEGLATDHGIRQITGSYAHGNGYAAVEVGAACAYGNAALDVLKRTGKKRTVANTQSLAGRLNIAFNAFVGKWYIGRGSHTSIIGTPYDILALNDVAKLSFSEIAKSLNTTKIPKDEVLRINFEFLEDETHD